MCGTAMFVSDELGLNGGRLMEGKEVVIISCEPEKIAEVGLRSICPMLRNSPRWVRMASARSKGSSRLRFK